MYFPFHRLFRAVRRPYPPGVLILVGAVVIGMAFPRTVRGQIDDMGILRSLVENDYRGVRGILDEWNMRLIRNVERTSPAQAAELRSKLELPGELPQSDILALGISNYGQGLVSFLFEEDFVVEQVNLLFCNGKVGAVQVLFDDSLTFGDTPTTFSRLYGMGPAVPFGSHSPAFQYRLPGVSYDEEGRWSLDTGAEPVTVWDMGTREALYQPVNGRGLISGQFWLTSRELAAECAEAAAEASR